MYTPVPSSPPPLFRPNMLQLLIAPQEIIGISLDRKLPHIRFLHKILIALLLRKGNRILPALEVDMCALHEIGG
jgi:hypothetical protein